jgi:hypothetical protein
MTTQINNNQNQGGIGFFGLLQILFIGLKLTNYIDWSWWWVLSPTLIGIILLFIIFAVLVIFYD